MILTLNSADCYQFEAQSLVWFIVSCRSAFSLNSIDVYSHREETQECSQDVDVRGPWEAAQYLSHSSIISFIHFLSDKRKKHYSPLQCMKIRMAQFEQESQN